MRGNVGEEPAGRQEGESGELVEAREELELQDVDGQRELSESLVNIICALFALLIVVIIYILSQLLAINPRR